MKLLFPVSDSAQMRASQLIPLYWFISLERKEKQSWHSMISTGTWKSWWTAQHELHSRTLCSTFTSTSPLFCVSDLWITCRLRCWKLSFSPTQKGWLQSARRTLPKSCCALPTWRTSMPTWTTSASVFLMKRCNAHMLTALYLESYTLIALWMRLTPVGVISLIHLLNFFFLLPSRHSESL